MKTLLYIILSFFIIMNTVAQDTTVPADTASVPKTKKNRKKIFAASNDSTKNKEDYTGSPEIRYENYTYNSNIKTVQLYRNGFETTDPILNLNENEQLKIAFDDLDVELKTYNYTVIHCDANWEPSNILPADYLGGFLDDYFRSYKYSFNTTKRYIHYSTIFPNDNIKITKSGNYILKVYRDYDPEKIILTRRFCVLNNKISISQQFKRPTIIEQRNYKQEIDFTIDYSGTNVPNPFGDLKVILLQNGRWDNAIRDLKPVFVNDNKLIYDYDETNNFNGVNEFREFDDRSLRFITAYINRYEFDSTKTFNVHLLNDERKAYKRYLFKNDINGKYVIECKEGSNPDTDADYANVHFYYPAETPFEKTDIYVFGQLSDWTYKKEFKMIYDERHKAYVLTALLKQGFYNYIYVGLKDGEPKPDDTIIEGNFFDTENDYTIMVYFRQMGTNYDQIIGYLKFNTIKN